MLPRPTKRITALLVDALMCAASVHIAYFLRTNDWPAVYGPALYPTLTSISLALPIFIICGLYRAIFRFGGTTAILGVLKAVSVYTVPFAFFYSYVEVPGVPRTIGLLQPIVLLLLVAGSRAIASAWLGQSYRNVIADHKKVRVLIYGAGSSGRQVASALQVSGHVRVIGFLDDDRAFWKSTINGKRVFPPCDIDKLVDRFGVTDVLLAINKASRARRNEIIAQLKRSGLHIRTMPGVDQLARGTVSFTDLKDLDIDDLLARAPIAPAQDLLARNIAGKVVLVTGAGGSIGSELCRQINLLSPDTLLLVDASEYNLYAIHQELDRTLQSENIVRRSVIPLLANVRDRRRIDEIVQTWRPDTIYHAAAYKHVPMVEHNVLDGLSNNVVGTLNVALAARKYKVGRVVLISTDKAVRPTNIMGATKRLAELILQALDDDERAGRFSMVRFGNVLGSSGSVVPLFRGQIASGGPVTITHPDVTRYFMTIPEAAQLVIQASAMGVGGDVFVLDMGEPVKIVDLARAMIELSGLRVQGDTRDHDVEDNEIAIDFIGLRPGEKLFEELLIGNEPSTSEHSRILRAHESFISWDRLEPSLNRLQRIIDDGDTKAARLLLRELVVEFTPASDIVDFVALRLGEPDKVYDRLLVD